MDTPSDTQVRQRGMEKAKQVVKQIIKNEEVYKKQQQVYTSNEKKQEERLNKILNSVADYAPQNLTKYAKIAVPYFQKLFVIIDAIYPYLEQGYKKCAALYNYLPVDILEALFGLLICFFGSFFTVTIAAYEAFIISGWEQVKESLSYLYSEYELVKIANEQDNLKDDDGDGIPDVDQIDGKQVLTRKINLFLISCQNPSKVQDCIGGIFTSIFAVLTALKVQFARTILLGAQIGEQLRNPANMYIGPMIARVLPKEYHKWINVIINYTCKSIAISIAWTIQKVISGVQSAIRGGLIFSRKLIQFTNKKGYTNIDTDQSCIDEAIGWAVAAMGIYFQFSHFFGLPFPFNILLIPIRLIEYTLIWMISE